MAKTWFRKDTKTWYVRYKGEKILVGKNQRAAKLLVDKINLEEAEGRVGIHKLREKDLISFFNEIFDLKGRENLKEKTIIRYRGIIKNFLNYLDLNFPTVKNLSQLNPAVFESYIHFRKTTYLNKNGFPVTDKQLKERKDLNLKTGASDRTIRTEIYTIKSILQYAVKDRDLQKRYLRENPLERFNIPKARDQKEKRPLTHEEAKKLLSFFKKKNKELYEIFFTLLYTGMRDGEVRYLEWRDVDFNKRVITLKEKQVKHIDGTVELWAPKTKKGKREIPIHEKLYLILKKRKQTPETKSNFVFPDEHGGKLKRKIIRDFQRAMRTIGVDDVMEVHTLRRTFISSMAMKGVPRETTMDIVGHVDESTYELYRQSSIEHRKESVNKLDFGS